jgi:uncharacterized membrane protein
MTLGDWSTSATNLAIGFFLGMAGYSLAQLFLAGAWTMAIGVILPFLGLLIFILLFDRVSDRLLGFRTPTSPRPTTRQGIPLPRKLSLPAGFLLGALAALLGLSDRILGAL